MSSEQKKQGFGYGWAMVVAAGILYFFCGGLTTDGLNVTVPAFAESRGWSPGTLLAVTTPAGWIGLLGTIAFSQIVSKKGPKFAILLGMFATGVVCFFYGAANSILVYGICLTLIYCFANGFGVVANSALIANWFPKKRGYALGWGSIGLPLATAIYVPVFAMLIHNLGVGMAFNLLGGVIIAFAILFLFVLKNTPEEAGLPPDGDYTISRETMEANLAEFKSHQSEWTVGKLLKNKTVWIMSFCYGLIFLVTVGIVSQMVPRLMSLGYDQNFALAMLSLAALSGIIGSVLWGVLDMKTSTKFATKIFCIWYVVALLVLILSANSLPGTVLACVLAGIGIGGIGNIQPSMLAQVFGRYDFAAASRVVNTVVGFIRVTSFAIIGITLNITGSFDTAYLILMAVTLIALVLAFVMDDRCIGRQ